MAISRRAIESTEMFGLTYLIPVTVERKCIPMDYANVYVQIIDQIAHVSLSQRYTNRSSTSPVDASYVFPVPAKAAVCAFNFVRGDGTKVSGVAKEKQEAKAEYQAAVKAGRTAALGEEQTKDGKLISCRHRNHNLNKFSFFSIQNQCWQYQCRGNYHRQLGVCCGTPR